MKSYLKPLIVFLLFSALLFTYTSCSGDDDNSLGDFWVSWATITGEENGRATSFLLDDNDSTTLFVAATSTAYQPKNKRVIMNYTLLSDNYGGYDYGVKLNGYHADVLTKDVLYIDPLDQAKQDSIGNDPISIYSVWEGGGYLNFYFGYQSANQKAHFINLTSGISDLSVASDVVELEFRHNQKDDPQHYLVKGYASFDLAPYRIKGRNSLKFKIKVQITPNETKVYEIDYKYNHTD